MFTPTSLAARIERAEAQLSRDIGLIVISRGKVPDAFVEEVGGGVAVFAGSGSPMNKIIGVGFGAPPDADRLAAIEDLFAARGAHVQAEVSTLADPAWHGVFAPRGYVVAGFENVLGLVLGDAGQPAQTGASTKIEIVECTTGNDDTWLDVVATGFQHPDAVPAQAEGQEYPREVIEQAFADFRFTTGFRRYLAYADGHLAGGGGLREFDGVAQLCGAATLPAFRRRGVQSALLEARLRDAAARGCDLAVVTTAPGSRSMQNAQRRGFALLYARALHVRPPAVATGLQADY